MWLFLGGAWAAARGLLLLQALQDALQAGDGVVDAGGGGLGAFGGALRARGRGLGPLVRLVGAERRRADRQDEREREDAGSTTVSPVHEARTLGGRAPAVNRRGTAGG